MRWECEIRNTSKDCWGDICVSEACTNLELIIRRAEYQAAALPLNRRPYRYLSETWATSVKCTQKPNALSELSSTDNESAIHRLRDQQGNPEPERIK